MRILFYQDLPSVNSTLLTWTLAEELRLRGHHVDYGKPKDGKYDWVHGAGQDTWAALKFARIIGAKCHVHLEGLGYWRVGLDRAIDWGYDRNLEMSEIAYWKDHYQEWMSAAYEADSCTVNGEKQVKAIEWLFGGKKLPNCHLISCGADARYALTLPNWPTENYMITVSRLEPNKKVFMIAQTLRLLADQGVKVPPWMVVGTGTKEQWIMLQTICGDKIQIWTRTCFGAMKWRKIKMARTMLCGWMGIPPAEGILCKVPVLSFGHHDIKEMYSDTIWYAEDNNIEDYARMVKWMLELTEPNFDTGVPDWNEVPAKTLYAKNRLMGYTKKELLYACTLEQEAERYEQIFKEALSPVKADVGQ